jgi:Uma2 family endonuclease
MAIDTQQMTQRLHPADLPPGEWPQQGAWTPADWERLPADDVRYEVIDGVLFMTTAPSAGHQWVVAHLTRFLLQHMDTQPATQGLLFPAPMGVILPTGPVIPDLVYVSIERIAIVTEKRIVGVPDLVVEIASPGTAGYDRREKQDAYARSGVSEYWWIEPANRTVEVLVLDGDRYETLALVSGKATIPSRVLPGLAFAVDSIFMPRDLIARLTRDE